MPNLMAHYFFAQDLYNEFFETIGTGKDEYDAFLLGSQGPDILFYVFNPFLPKNPDLGHQFHQEKPTELLSALKECLSILDESEYAIGHAYAQGFLCHYALDSSVHPLVYAQVNAYCDAGEEGLTREYASPVHVVMEAEFDEMMLWNRKRTTIRDFNYAAEILQASQAVQTVVNKMFVHLSLTVYQRVIPLRTFSEGLVSYRTVNHLLRSPSGLRRPVYSVLECAVRRKRFSSVAAMMPRAIALEESVFENRAHNPWVDPSSGLVRFEDFWQLFETGKRKARNALNLFEKKSFGKTEAQSITKDLNFSGMRTTAQLVSVEDVTETAEGIHA